MLCGPIFSPLSFCNLFHNFIYLLFWVVRFFMSESDKKQSKGHLGGGGGGGGSGGGSDGEDEIDGPAKKNCSKEESGYSCGRGRKGVSLFRFIGAKKKLLLLHRRRRKGGSINSRSLEREEGGDGVGCCLCMKPPMTLDSSAESPTSDPNSKEFTYDMLRVFIEKNDFYARECNPHLDAK